MKEHDVLRAQRAWSGGFLREGRGGDVVGDGAGKVGQIVKKETGIIQVHSMPFVTICSGRKTGQVSWGLHVLIPSLSCRSVGSHV